MALKKSILQSDGLTTEYHRILSIDSIINNSTTIVVASYINETARNNELNHEIESPYQKTNKYIFNYIENLTISSAYSLIKTLDNFKNSEDVLENRDTLNKNV